MEIEMLNLTGKETPELTAAGAYCDNSIRDILDKYKNFEGIPSPLQIMGAAHEIAFQLAHLMHLWSNTETEELSDLRKAQIAYDNDGSWKVLVDGESWFAHVFAKELSKQGFYPMFVYKTDKEFGFIPFY